jgi:hypothetical protein
MEKCDTITKTLEVDAMKIDSVPEPINFVVLIQAAVNEGLARIVLDTKGVENARLRHAVALLLAKKEYWKQAKATHNPSRQISKSVSLKPSSLGLKENTVNSAVVDGVAALELQLSRLYAQPPLITTRGKTLAVQV